MLRPRNPGRPTLLCGCFCCLHVFEATEVIDWIDDGDTPLCPDCGVDAVLEGVTDLAELWRLRAQRFGGVQPRGRPQQE